MYPTIDFDVLELQGEEVYSKELGASIFKGKVFFNGDLVSPKTGSCSIIWKHCPVLSILTYFNVGTSVKPIMVLRKSKWED